jgi:hypothetical protein
MWVRRWDRTFETPMRRAGRTMLRTTIPAVEGSTQANFTLINALNRIGKCQSDLFELEPVPPDVSRVHALSTQVCRKLFVANDRVVDALNAEDDDLAREVLRQVSGALRQLDQAQQAARSATTA